MNRPMTQQLVQLKYDFDSGFAAPSSVNEAREVDMLLFSVAGVRHGIELGQLVAVQPCPRVIGVPGSLSSMVGVACVRGQLIAVYALGALLGLEATQVGKWIALAAGEALALTFDECQGLTRIPLEAHANAQLEPSGLCRRASFQTASQSPTDLRIVEVPALVARLQQSASAATITKDTLS